MSEKLYRVKLNSKGMPDFSTAVEVADRPSEIIYGNEHNCIMTIFGECSYAETGCGDCAVVEKVRKALSADRPQGEWIIHKINGIPHTAECSCCHNHYDYEDLRRIGGVKWMIDLSYCPNCGARMKGADDDL